MDHRARQGEAAERLACGFLRRRGARILGRNLLAGGGEIDLLIDLAGERAVVEVRSVSGEAGPTGSDPVLAYDSEKARRVVRAARALHPPVSRIDLVAVRFHRLGADLHWVPRVGP